MWISISIGRFGTLHVTARVERGANYDHDDSAISQPIAFSPPIDKKIRYLLRDESTSKTNDVLHKTSGNEFTCGDMSK